MKKIGVLASGRGTNLQSIIDSIEKKEIKNAELSVVISDNKDALALKRAKKHGIPAVFIDPYKFKTKEEFDDEILRVLKKYECDLVLLAGYMRILSPKVVKEFKWRIMNIHPALLPSFPGLNAQKQALEYGVKVSGCTVHFVDEGVDTGPIILQKAVEVKEDDTPETLADRILKEENKLYPLAVKLFLEDKLEIEGRRVKIRW
ncbi:MAG: phosphoribosylglycinamide formyltransferase [Candidatus Hydrothermarchaeota archaeon]